MYQDISVLAHPVDRARSGLGDVPPIPDTVDERPRPFGFRM
jgi:hypothetical protein